MKKAQDLYYELFLNPEKWMIKSIIDTVKTQAKDKTTATIEKYGEFILDREFEEADIAFLRSVALKDIEFTFPKDNRESPTFTIKKKDSDEFLICSNRLSTRGELRGEVLRNGLMNQLEIDDNQNLYKAIENLINKKFSESMQFKYLMPTLVDFKSFKPLISQIGDHISKAYIENPNISNEELTNIAHDYFVNQGNQNIVLPERPTPPIEKTSWQSFGKPLALGLACLAIVIGAVLSLTGVLAPLGLPILSGNLAIASWIATGITFATGATCAYKVVDFHDKDYDQYQADLQQYRQKYDEKLEKSISELVKPLDEAYPFENEKSENNDLNNNADVRDKQIDNADPKIKMSRSKSLPNISLLGKFGGLLGVSKVKPAAKVSQDDNSTPDFTSNFTPKK